MDNFPTFKDGDVKIVITGARQYQLHSNILKASSALMRRLLDDKYTAKLSKKAIKRGVVVRNKIHAIKNHGDDYVPLEVGLFLDPINLDSEGRAIDAEPIGPDLENGIVVPPIYTAYDLVLGAFYHRPLDLGRFGEASLTDILEMALFVVEVAEYLEVVDMITKPIEAELLSTGQVVQRSIAADPPAWLEFAYRIRSKPVFKEALIHAVGQYNTAPVQYAMKNSMRQDILEIVQKKSKTLYDAVKSAVRNILSYYPYHLQRARTMGYAEVDNYGRNSYSNDIFNWMALTVFRHYITQHIANDMTHHAPDMGFWLISAMGTGGDRYLDKATQNHFHEIFPMSNRAMAVMENNLNTLKEEVKTFVEGLVYNASQLNVTQHSYQYFTCTNVDWWDYPWVDQPKERASDDEDDDEEDEDDGEDEEEDEERGPAMEERGLYD